MKEIQLTQGQVALVDDEDWTKLESYTWCAIWQRGTKSYYASGRPTKGSTKNTSITSMSRLIMGLTKGDKRVVDHINHDTLDNRKQNLRVVTHQQNMQNQKNVKGYHYRKKTKQWRVNIYQKGKTIQIGEYATEEEAKLAYLKARQDYGYVK